MLLQKRRRSPAFTLIELMIVIAIIAILAAILVPNFLRARSRSQLTVCVSNLKNLASGIEMYSAEWGGKYPATLGLVAPKYVKIIPQCEVAGADTYTSSYTVSTSPDTYEIFCEGNYHLAFTNSADYPRYDPKQGLIERQ